MDELLIYLRQFATFTHSEIEHMAGLVQEISLAEDEYFLDIDEIPKAFCFVRCGVLRAGCYNAVGEEVTKRFVVERHFLSDVYAIQQSIPSREFVQAAVKSKLMILTRSSINELSAAVRNWETTMAMIAIHVLKERENSAGRFPGSSATSRFMAFERSYPGLADRIGLGHVASCLGMSVSTLSRIKRSLVGLLPRGEVPRRQKCPLTGP